MKIIIITLLPECHLQWEVEVVEGEVDMATLQITMVMKTTMMITMVMIITTTVEAVKIPTVAMMVAMQEEEEEEEGGRVAPPPPLKRKSWLFIGGVPLGPQEAQGVAEGVLCNSREAVVLMELRAIQGAM